MLKKLTSYWQYGATFCGIEVVSDTDGIQLYQTTAKKKEDEFVAFQFNEAETFETLSQDLKKRQHCFLVINTDQVLIKEIAATKNSDNALSLAFPGLSADDFYYQITNASNKYVVSVIKKSVVNELLNLAQAAKFDVIGFTIGFGSVKTILPLINSDIVNTASYCLKKEDNDLLSFESSQTSSQKYQIADIEVSSNWLLSLATLFNYEQTQISDSNIEEKTKTLKTNHLEKNFFKRILILGVAVFFVGMLVNLFFFTRYNTELQKSQNDSAFATIQSKQIESRLKNIAEKETLVFNIINNGNSLSTLYINTIVTNLPETIILTELQYQPLLKSVRPDKPIEYDANQIILGAESIDKTIFSNWLKAIEDEEWVDAVTVVAYGVSSNKLDKFRLLIKIKDETTN